MSNMEAALDRLVVEVAAGRITQAEATAIVATSRAEILASPSAVVPPAVPAGVETGISDLQHLVDVFVREDGLSRASAFELIAERQRDPEGQQALAAMLLSEKVRYVAGVEIDRQLKEAGSEVSREQLGLAHAAHAAKVRNLGAAARDHLLAEAAINGLTPDDVASLSDLDALSAAGYAVPVAPAAPVVDVTRHPAYLDNLAAIAKLEAADAAGKDRSA